MFADKTVVVLGATGVVGSGVVRKYLDAGATVVGVSRSGSNLERLKQQIGVSDSEPFVGVVGDFVSEASAAEVFQSVAAALGGRAIDHVVSVLGFAAVGAPPTATALDSVTGALADGLFNSFLAAKVFLPSLKSREGSSYTIVSGGLAHMPPPFPGLWLATVKNAAVNALSNSLASETAKDAVRVNTMCIHFGVAPIGGSKNQFGMPAESDTLRLGPAFLAVARGTQKGQIICLDSWSTTDRIAAS